MTTQAKITTIALAAVLMLGVAGPAAAAGADTGPDGARYGLEIGGMT